MNDVNAVKREERIEFDGKQYTLPYPSFEAEGIFQTWLEERAMFKILQRRFKPGFGEQWYREQSAIWQRDATIGNYGYHSEVGFLVCRTGNCDGWRELSFILFSQSTPGMTRELANRIWDAKRQEIIDALIRLESPTPTTPPAEASGANT